MTPRRTLTPALVYAAFLGLNALVYLGGTGGRGFPLDDAWIHQVFARSLALDGRLAFQSGFASTGSTAPLWSAWLALGRALPGLPLEAPAYLLGSSFALGAALLTFRLAQRWFGWRWMAVFAGLLYLLDWRTAWAALSGMEITLATFLALLFFDLLSRQAHPALCGAAAGVLVLVRPEGALLGGIFALVRLTERQVPWKARVGAVLLFLLPFCALAGLLVGYNFAISGRLLQSTVYAKYLQWSYPWTPLKALKYLGDVLLYFLASPLVLPACFLPVGVAAAVRQRMVSQAAAVGWIGALILLYAAALPSLYHHGRYIMLLIPLVVLLGLAGIEQAARRFRRFGRFWLACRALAAVMSVVLWVNGASTYALEVRLLTRNQQDAALWLKQHSQPGEVIATHDIGLIGYFSGREVFDLAGLVSPETQAYLREPAGLASLCRERGVRYLALFPGYYPGLLAALDAHRVYSPPGAAELIALNLEPFEVYAVGSP